MHADLLRIFDDSSKVKNRWTQILGGGKSGNDLVARVALRKKLGKEPSTGDFAKYIEWLTPEVYATLAKELKDDVDKAFRDGEEVCLVRFPEPWI